MGVQPIWLNGLEALNPEVLFEIKVLRITALQDSKGKTPVETLGTSLAVLEIQM